MGFSDEERLLENNNVDDDSTTTTPHPPAPWSKILLMHSRTVSVFSTITFILTLLTLTILATLLAKPSILSIPIPQPRPILPQPNDTLITTTWKRCGNNSAEARSLGCLFDVMLTTWIHADCYDADLHEQYLAATAFPWYRDPEQTIRLGLAEVRRGDYYEIYSDRFYHYAHCGYAWEMILRAYRRGKAIERELWAMEHTLHCVKNLLEHEEGGLDRTVLNVGFESCGRPYT